MNILPYSVSQIAPLDSPSWDEVSVHLIFMPNKLKAGTLRVSYVENQAINRAISILASVKGVTISSLIREATEQYLTREDPKGEILKTAKELVAGQSESVDQRVTEPVNPEVIAKLTALIKKVGSGSDILTCGENG